jgi:hypothetical protein
MEGIHDAHHRAEQADERSHGADGGQPGETPLQNRQRFARRRLGCALQCDDVLRRPETAGLTAIRLIDLIEDTYQRAGLELLADRRNLLQAAGLTKGAQEAAALRSGPAKGGSFAQNNGPGV